MHLGTGERGAAGSSVREHRGTVSSASCFEEAWCLLVDGEPWRGLCPPEFVPLASHSGSALADVVTYLAQLHTRRGFRPLGDIDPDQAREDAGLCVSHMFSALAQSARGPYRSSVPLHTLHAATGLAELTLLQWHGAADPPQVAEADRFLTGTALSPEADAACRTAASLRGGRLSAPLSLAACVLAYAAHHPTGVADVPWTDGRGEPESAWGQAATRDLPGTLMACARSGRWCALLLGRD